MAAASASLSGSARVLAANQERLRSLRKQLAALQNEIHSLSAIAEQTHLRPAQESGAVEQHEFGSEARDLATGSRLVDTPQISAGSHSGNAPGLPTAAALPVIESHVFDLTKFDEDTYASHVNFAASAISQSIALSRNTEEQCRRMDLAASVATALKKPMPVSLLEAHVPEDQLPYASPALDTNFLHYVGDPNAFYRALASVGSSDQSAAPALIVAQASGSGKSRLAYLAGTQNIVGFVQLVNYGSDAMPLPWQRFCSGAAKCPVLSLNAMLLLLVSYVEFATDVAAKYKELHPDADVQLLRHIVLRCLRNGKGHEGAELLFSRALSTTTLASLGLETWHQVHPVVEAHCKSVHAKLNAVFTCTGEVGEVVLFVDEAQGLVTRPDPVSGANVQVQSRKSTGPGSQRDALYVLTLAVEHLRQSLGWKSVICGSWLDLVTLHSLPESSAFSTAPTVICHASTITAKDMWGTLTTHFNFRLDDAQEKRVMELLAMLRGRPANFYRFFLPHFMRTTAECTDDFPALLEQQLKAACGRIAETGRRLMGSLWASYAQPTSGLERSITPGRLIAKLYFAIKMSDAQLKFDDREVEKLAVRHGILLHPRGCASDSPDAPVSYSANIGDEPCLKAAIEEFFDAKVHNDSKFGGQLLQLIGGAFHHEWDCSGQVDAGAKGPAFEQLVAMSLIIASIGSTSDGEAMDPISVAPAQSQPDLAWLLQRMGVLPEAFDVSALAHCPVRISRAVNTGGNERVFHELLDGTLPEGTLAYNIHPNAGADLAFCTVGSSPRRLVMIQVKTQATTSLHDLVRAATPAWQFHTDVIAKMSARANGETVKPDTSRTRNQFLETARTFQYEMEHAIRVVFTSAAYQPQTVKLVNGINRLPRYRDSPLCLCMSSERAFGKCHDRLLQLSGGTPIVAHPQYYRMLPPYNDLTKWDNINSIPLVVDLDVWRLKIEALSSDPRAELTEEDACAWRTAITGAM